MVRIDTRVREVVNIHSSVYSVTDKHEAFPCIVCALLTFFMSDSFVASPGALEVSFTRVATKAFTAYHCQLRSLSRLSCADFNISCYLRRSSYVVKSRLIRYVLVSYIMISVIILIGIV